uniref:Phosphoenolpyruvate carboxykinase ATP n=1 Tax=Rhizophora mucronata TaxID=61149 RepID=A0A2P2KB75_RHIMU
MPYPAWVLLTCTIVHWGPTRLQIFCGPGLELFFYFLGLVVKLKHRPSIVHPCLNEVMDSSIKILSDLFFS